MDLIGTGIKEIPSFNAHNCL